MLELKVEQTDFFKKQIKELRKRYRRVEGDVDLFLKSLGEVGDLGVSLGGNLFKARLKNTDAARGKSGGYRLITYLQLKDSRLTLIYIYSKSDLKNISEDQLDKIVMKTVKQ